VYSAVSPSQILLAVKRGRETSKPERLVKAGGAEERRSPQKAGRGAKSDRRQEEAIAALLTQRNVEEAARVAGTESPVFDAS
jgi:hypothetical protein